MKQKWLSPRYKLKFKRKLMRKIRKNWEKVCGVRKIVFSFSEETGSETEGEVEKS